MLRRRCPKAMFRRTQPRDAFPARLSRYGDSLLGGGEIVIDWPWLLPGRNAKSWCDAQAPAWRLAGAYGDDDVLETHANICENSTNNIYTALGVLRIGNGAETPIVNFAAARLPSIMQALFEKLEFRTLRLCSGLDVRRRDHEKAQSSSFGRRRPPCSKNLSERDTDQDH
jgi:hypothetical protein